MVRKSASDAFARSSPWPGYREAPRPSGRKALILSLVSLIPATYWAVSAVNSDGWVLAGNLLAAGAGTVMAAYYIREWARSRHDVRVEW